MLDILGYAFLSTLATILTATILLCFLSMFLYMLDHWVDYADFVKALGICLVIFIAWIVFFASGRYANAPPNNIEIQSNDTQTTA